MQLVPFGPLVTKSIVHSQGIKYLLEKFNNSKREDIDDEVIINHQTGWLDATDSYSNTILRPHIQNYLDIVNWEGGFKITSLWGNIYKSKEYIHPHAHRECDLSFTLIAKAPPLEFLNFKKSEGQLILTYGEPSSFFQKIDHITRQAFIPIEGELLIFPQNLNHYTIPMTHPEAERISISGNILLNE